MAFGTLEDLEGSFELVIFSERLRAAREPAASAWRSSRDRRASRADAVSWSSGTLEAGDPPKILVREVLELTEARGAALSRSYARPREGGRGDPRSTDWRLRESCSQGHPGDCAVFLHIMIPGESETVWRLGRKRPRRRIRSDESAPRRRRRCSGAGGRVGL